MNSLALQRNPCTVAVHSVFLGRTVWITPKMFKLLVLLMRHRKGWRQRELAEAAGYSGPGGVSKALHDMQRLGLVALSTARGCHGSTVAWIRKGVQAIGRGLGQRMFPNTTERGSSIHTVRPEVGNIRSVVLPRGPTRVVEALASVFEVRPGRALDYRGT